MPENVRTHLLLPEVFKVVFNFLKSSELDKIFYVSSKVDWTKNFLEKKHESFSLNDISIPVKYYKKTTKILSYRVPNVKTRERLTTSTTITKFDGPDLIINWEKTKSALYVNSIHALDALYLRYIVHYCSTKNIPIITIHDGFFIPFYNETTLISIANTAFLDGCEDQPGIKIKSTTILI